MVDRGYNIDGVEISLARREIAEEICNNNIYQYNFMGEMPTDMLNKYDFILLYQVLEHIIEPKKFLGNINLMLKEHGKVIIEVPNLEDHLLKISREYFDFFYQEAHVCYYSPKSLVFLLEQCDYKNIDIYGQQRYSIENMMNWIINKKPQISNTSYDVINELKWINDYYSKELSNALKTDTIVAVASRR